MKSSVNEVRRTHTQVVYRNNGTRQETEITGDIRHVTVSLEPGDVDDFTIITERFGKRVEATMRPQRVVLRWQRNQHWADGRWGNTSWSDQVHDGWVLEDAIIQGVNVLRSGQTGKESLSRHHAAACHIERPLDEMPDWFAALVAQHDPKVHGSPLDNEDLPVAVS